MANNSPKEIEKLIKDLQKLASTGSDLTKAFQKIQSVLSKSGPLLQSQVQSFTKLLSQSKQLQGLLTSLSKGYGNSSKRAQEILSNASQLTGELKKQVALSDKLAKNMAKIKKNGGLTPAGRGSSRRPSNKPVNINTSSLEKELEEQTKLLRDLLKAQEKSNDKDDKDKDKDKKGAGGNTDTQKKKDDDKGKFEKYFGTPFNLFLRKLADKSGRVYDTLKTEQPFSFSEERKQLFDMLLMAGKDKDKDEDKKDKDKDKKKNNKKQQPQTPDPANNKAPNQDTRAEQLGGRGIENVILEVGRGIIDVLEEIRDCMDCKRADLTKDDRLKGTGYRRTESGQTASWDEVVRMQRRERLYEDKKPEEKPAEDDMLGTVQEGSEETIKKLPAVLSVPLGLLAMGFKIMLKLAEEMERPVREITQEIGVGAAQAQKMSIGIRNAFVNAGKTAVTMKELQGVVTGISKEYEGIVLSSKYYNGETGTAVLRLAETAKYVGISGDEMTSFSELLRRQVSGRTAEVAANFSTIALQAAETAGVAPGIIAKDMVQNAGRLVSHFGGAEKKMVNAGIAVRKMGFSLKEAFDLEDTLLDFEGSITASLEASVALGRTIDLTAARTAMLQEGPEGMLREIKKLMTGDEFNKLGYAQKRIFADMLKMDVADLQKKLYVTGTELNEGVQDGLEKSKKEIEDFKAGDKASMSPDAYFPMESIRNAFEQLRQSIISTNEDTINGFANKLSDFINSQKEKLIPGIMKFAEAGTGFYEWTMKVISGQKDLGDILKDVKDVFMKGIKMLIDAIREMISGRGPNVAAEKNKKDKDEFLKTATGSTASVDPKTGMPAYGTNPLTVKQQEEVAQYYDDTFQKKYTQLEESNKTRTIPLTGAQMRDIARQWTEKNVAKYVQQLGIKQQAPGVVPNIKDGIVQNGQIITTHPDDYIMAIKDPAKIDASTGPDMQRLLNVEYVLKDILSTLRTNNSTPTVHYVDFGDGTVEKLNQRLRLVNTKYG